MLKKGNNSNTAERIKMKIWPQIDLIMQNLAKPNVFGDICKKLPSDPYDLFLVMKAMFFDR